MRSPFVVVVDSGFPRCPHIAEALSGIGCEHRVASVHDAFDVISSGCPDVVIVTAAETDAAPQIECLRRLRAAFAYPRYLFVAGTSSEELAIAAFHSGAQRYLREPWTAPMLQSAVTDLLPPMETPAPPSRSDLVGGERLAGESGAMREIRAQIARIAAVSSNVLIGGETGTGKELVAELLHLNSPRAHKPLVCLNTAAIPEALLENELFGHERGAFTGAQTSDPGKLAAASGGTVFLDEIGDTGPHVQAKLLRVLENKPIYRLGGTRGVKIDVRILAATNHDLVRAVAEGRFRRDLYYRLNVLRIDVPPLRDRAEDIPRLVADSLHRLNRDLGRRVRGLSSRAMDVLRAYPWPGNVRELRNVIEALVVNLAPETTGIVDLPPAVMRQLALAVSAPSSERERLLNVLTATNWNKTRAASQLCMSRMTLYRKMQQHSVTSPE